MNFVFRSKIFRFFVRHLCLSIKLKRNFYHQQTEELYEEILYQILHNVGCETENETCQSSLFGYIQDAFKVNKTHTFFIIFYVANQ